MAELARGSSLELRLVHFDIVHGCQLRCVGCPNATLSPNVRRITVNAFARCMANLDVARIGQLQLFNFGEPLLHDDLPGIFEAIRPYRHKIGLVEISTNAQFVRWPQLEAVIATKLIDRLAVSCDGDGTPESFERLRPPARWANLMTFLERVSELKRNLHPRLDLLTRTVIFNRSDMLPWNALLKPLGWIPHFRGFKIMPDAAENPSKRKFVPGKGVCGHVAPTDSLFVDADGTVVPCCIHPRAGEFGNLLHSKYSDILQGAARARFVDELANCRGQMSVCARCEFGPRGNAGPSSGRQLPGDSGLLATL